MECRPPLSVEAESGEVKRGAISDRKLLLLVPGELALDVVRERRVTVRDASMRRELFALHSLEAEHAHT
jgi:hypothetical protein